MKNILKGQFWNYTLLVPMIVLIEIIVKDDKDYLSGNLFGISTSSYLYIALLVPILHQFYVWFCWRFELHKNLLSKSLGAKAFNMYKVGFSILILARPVSVLLLSISNSGTLGLPSNLSIGLGIILVLPAIYLGYSVKKFFGIDRAYGIDHFQPESAKDWPMINEGIFKFSGNSMYAFGFLMLYSIALFADSKSGLLIAFFNHIYIWVHYFFTEKPDMKFIYADRH